MEKQDIAATPKHLKNAHRMIWGGLVAGTIFIMAGEVGSSIGKGDTFISSSPYSIAFFILSILSIFIIICGYYALLKANDKNLWWLLLLISLTPFVMLIASVLLYGFVWLSLMIIGSVFQLYF